MAIDGGTLRVLADRRIRAIALAEKMLFYGRLAAGNMADADKDGVPDFKDKCPNTGAGVKVGTPTLRPR